MTLVGFLAHLYLCTVGSYVLLSVCRSWNLTNIQTRKKFISRKVDLTSRSKVTWVKVEGHVGQGLIRVPNKGRWAHGNVKLLHFYFVMEFDIFVHGMELSSSL